MDLKFDYIFTETAERNLDNIITYIEEDLHNPTASENFYNKVFELIDKITIAPTSFAKIDNEFIKSNNVRKVFIDNYVLYYTFEQETQTIKILALSYAKRNLDEILKNLI